MGSLDDLAALTAEEKLAYAVLSKYGVMHFRAQVVDINGASYKLSVDGTTLDMYYPGLKMTYTIAVNDWVEALKIGEGFLVLGAAAVADDTGAAMDSLASRVNNLETFQNNHSHAQLAADGHGHAAYASDGHGHAEYAGNQHQHPASEINNPPWAGSGHGHTYGEINGTHGNGAHSPNFREQ